MTSRAHLVEHLREWKASSSLHLEYGDTVTFARPKCGLWAETLGPARKGKHGSRGRLRYRGRSKAPESATLALTRPDVLVDLTPKRFVAAYRKALDAFRGGGWPTFPYGTLQMVQRYDVDCAKAPP